MLGDKFPPSVRENFLKNDPKALQAANTAQDSWPDYTDCFLRTSIPRILFYGEHDNTYGPLNKAYAKKDSACKIIELKGLNHAQAYWSSDIIAPIIIEFIHAHFS